MADPNIVNPYERIWKTRDLRALEAPIELENNTSQFRRGLNAFGKEMQATGYGLAALGAQGLENAIGENAVTSGITDWGVEGYKKAIDESQSGYNAPNVADVANIKGVGDFTDWASYQLGKGLPMLGTLALSGGVGSAIGRLTAQEGVKQIAKGTIGSAVKKGIETKALQAAEGQIITKAMQETAAKALRDRAVAGAMTGGFAGSFGLEGGLAFGEQVGAGVKPEDAVKSAIAVGGINGALEFLPFYKVAKDIGMGQYAKKSIAEIIKNDAGLSKKAIALATTKELGGRAVKGGLEGVAAEGITEGLQELTSIAGLRWAKQDPLFAALSDDDWNRIGNAAVAGALVGGVAAGAGATLKGPEATGAGNIPTKTNTPSTDIAPPTVKTRTQDIETALAKLTTNLEAAKAAGDTKTIQELQQLKELYDTALGKQKPTIEPAVETSPNEQITQEQPIPGAAETQVQSPLEVPTGPEGTGGVREEGTGTGTRETTGEVVQPQSGESIQLKRGEEIVLTPDGTLARTTPTQEEIEALRQRMGPRPERQITQPIEEMANAQEVQAQTEAPVEPSAIPAQTELEKQAIAIGNNKDKLKERFAQAKSVLDKTTATLFKDATYDFDNKRLVSKDGNYALQWKIRDNPEEPSSYANQQTNAGVVSLINIGNTSTQVKGTSPLYSKPIEEIKSPNEGITTEATMEEFEAVRRQFQERQSQTPFKKWFGAGTPNITATKEGEPITLYHGTNNPAFYEWDSTKAGEASGHPTSGLGFFMTADQGAAARYGNNLLALHAKINNPYILTDADLTRIETPQDAAQLRKRLMSKGYDGAVVTAPGASPYVIAFQANQIKLKSNTTPTDSPDMRYSKPLQGRETSAPFYSALERATQEVKQQKAPASQWLGTLDTLVKKGIIRQEELDWSGTKEWLQDQKGPVTKEALLRHVKDNTLEVQETSLTDNPDIYALGEWIRARNADPNSKTEVLDWKWKGESKPSVTLVKVGENDWHTSLSPERGTLDEVKQEAEDHLKYAASHKFKLRNTNWTLPGGENQQELVLTIPSIEPFNTDDTTHYGDVGGGRAVAWVRFNARVDEDGNKTLFIEEIQSKRHQEGKSLGYAPSSQEMDLLRKREDAVFSKIEELGIFVYGTPENKFIVKRDYNELPENIKEELDSVISDIKYLKSEKLIPNAPFKQTIAGSGQTLSGWAGLAFKRILRYAVENGYDKVAWTTGEQQAERYNLAKKVTKVAYSTDGFFEAYDKNGSTVISKAITVDELPTYIGKDLTKDLLSSPVKNEQHTVELSETKVIGGEGMKGFYDRLLPNEINKYVKKWGAKVDRTQMEFGDETADVHSVEVTLAMRDSVMQGQPLFSKQTGKQKIVTPEMDAEYLSAVERGDIKAAQRMVNEAAKKAGYTVGPVYHGTDRKFNSFKMFSGELGEGAYFTSSRSEAKSFGGRLVKVFLKIENPQIVKEYGDEIRQSDFDSVILKQSESAPTEYAVFSPSQIKSADTVTRDDTGNVIPLSRRFEATTPDIRYTQQPGTVTIPLQDLQSSIDSIMGEGWLQQATEAGLVEVVEGEGPNGESGSWAGDRIRLYTGSMPKDGSPAGVLLHEGKHVTFEDVLGNSLPEYIKDLHTLADNGNKVAQDAITHAAIAVADVLGIKHNLLEDGTKADLKNLQALIEQERPGLLAEEELAYFVQYGADAQTGTGFWKRLVNQIKAWFAQTRLGQRMKELGIGFELTDAMAVEWAKMGLNRSLENLRQVEKARVQAEKQAAAMPASARLGKALGMLEEVDPLYAMTIAANEQIDKEIESIKKKYINTPQWMKAPNGKPTKLNERQWLRVRTPAFKNWFGDWENDSMAASQVVDANGEPLVVYHGTNKTDNFTEFNIRSNGTAYFTTKKEYANDMSKRKMVIDPITANDYVGQVIPVYLKLNNPAKLKASILEDLGYSSATIEKLKAFGHDGATSKDGQIAVFSPTQIKSTIGNVGTFSLTDSNILYSMGIQEIKQQLWNDPTDIRPEIVNKPGLLQKWRADFIDFFAEMEKKSKDIYDTYSLLRSKKAARIEQARQEYFLPLRKLIAESPWSAQEVGDMAAARHIKVDNVNTRLAQRASYGYTKELLKALSTTKRKELMQARINVKAGKMPDGSVYLDANGNPAQMSARTKQQLMFDLMNQYSQYEITGTDGIQVLREEWELFKDAAAGFSDGGVGSTKVRTVDNVLKAADKDRAKFNQIMTLFDAANRHTLELLEDGGLITAAEHARLLLDKSAYAPLRRESYKVDEEVARLFQRAGQGGSKQIATRSGTENLSEPTLVLQNALAAIEAAAAAAERNLANKELYKVVVKDQAGWKPWFTIVEKEKYVTHDEDGFLQEKNATASNRADITLINDGKKLVIRPNMHNERAMGFVRAVNNLDAQVVNGPMKVLGWLNQIVRWVNVSASPIFLMTNAFKDPFTALYNIQATEAEKYTKEIFSPKTYKDSFKALKKVFMDGNRDPLDPDVQWVEKWELAGGRTSFIETLRDMDETWKSFDAQVSRRKGTVFGINAPGFKNLMQAKDKWIDGIENFNILFENVMRFSTFRVLIEKGAVSEAQAARISQDLTTNFTRRGYKAQALGTWWLFFNASVQGNYQVLRNLMSSKKVQAAVGGTVVMALLLDLFGRAVDDDWDKIPEWDKERFIILPVKVAGDFVRIPAPWVYNVAWRTGGLLGEMLSGVKKPQDGLLDIAAMVTTTFNPLGKPGSLAQAISPTGFDPFMQIIENKNFAGNPIGPEGFPGASKKANSELMWSSTPQGYQSFARFVNEATGGSAVESGAIDLKPGDYQILANFLTGSLGRFMSDATFGVKEALNKGFEGMQDIPVVKEFFSDPYDPLKSQKYHTNVAGIYGAHKLEQMYIKGPERDLIKLQEVRENRGKELRMYSQAQDVERQLKSLRVRLRTAQNRGDTAREKELRDKIGKIQERFNNVYQQRMG